MKSPERAKSRMFPDITQTWNPVPGCRYQCLYCWARDLALGRLKDTPRYRNGFEPQLIEAELEKRFRKGLIFVNDMGDLWGRWVPREWIERVLQAVRESPGARFLMLTKNPERYLEAQRIMPDNVILGATVETNRYSGLVSHAPPVWDRLRAMHQVPEIYPRVISVEPILDFDPEIFIEGLRLVGPDLVYVGYDNHGHKLAEPSLEKTRQLIAELGEFTTVHEKAIRKAWWETETEL